MSHEITKQADRISRSYLMLAALFVHVSVRLPKVRFPQGGIMMSLIRWSVVVCLLSFTAALFAQDAPEGRLLRFPDISKDKIAFVYGGDIWLVASSGGAARRVTTYPGRELFPKFSPDGKWLAFTGQYDGNFNVYVMPAEGGQPKQLTFDQGGTPLSDRMGIHNEVVTWTPDSKRIVFLTRRDSF